MNKSLFNPLIEYIQTKRYILIIDRKYEINNNIFSRFNVDFKQILSIRGSRKYFVIEYIYINSCAFLNDNDNPFVTWREQPG